MKTAKIRQPKKEVVQKIRSLAKSNKIKVRVRAMPYDAFGECRLDGKLISLNNQASKRELLHTFFHELGHLYCIRRGVWKDFHRGKPATPKQIFHVENWIERWAKKEWSKEGMYKKYGPYKFFYAKKTRPSCLRWIKNNY